MINNKDVRQGFNTAVIETINKNQNDKLNNIRFGRITLVNKKNLTATVQTPQGQTYANLSLPKGSENTVAIGDSCLLISSDFYLKSQIYIAGVYSSGQTVKNYLWQTWTPSWTNLSVGDGGTAARYYILDNLVFFSLNFTFGSTTSISAFPAFSLPVSKYSITMQMNALYLDNGTLWYPGYGLVGGDNVELYAFDTTSTYAGMMTVNTSVPFTWVAGDAIVVNGVYERSSSQ